MLLNLNAVPKRHVQVLEMKDLPDLKGSGASNKRARGGFAQPVGAAKRTKRN